MNGKALGQSMRRRLVIEGVTIIGQRDPRPFCECEVFEGIFRNQHGIAWCWSDDSLEERSEK